MKDRGNMMGVRFLGNNMPYFVGPKFDWCKTFQILRMFWFPTFTPLAH